MAIARRKGPSFKGTGLGLRDCMGAQHQVPRDEAARQEQAFDMLTCMVTCEVGAWVNKHRGFRKLCYATVSRPGCKGEEGSFKVSRWFILLGAILG